MGPRARDLRCDFAYLIPVYSTDCEQGLFGIHDDLDPGWQFDFDGVREA